ncbi:plant/F18G18-20 protein [Spatholobus suberectus]|nr:plant/F18G18-20 protein [Spatholobus suberectus]
MASSSSRAKSSGPVLRSHSPSSRFCSYTTSKTPFSSPSSAFASSTSSSFSSPSSTFFNPATSPSKSQSSPCVLAHTCQSIQPRPSLFWRPVLDRPPVYFTEPVHLEPDHHEEQPSDLGAEEDLYVLAHHAPWLVPMQPPQEHREQPPRGFVPSEPSQHAQIRDEELSGEDRRRGGRVGQKGPNRIDSAQFASTEEESGVRVQAQSSLCHVQG